MYAHTRNTAGTYTGLNEISNHKLQTVPQKPPIGICGNTPFPHFIHKLTYHGKQLTFTNIHKQ